jgi:hypothetical protein
MAGFKGNKIQEIVRIELVSFEFMLYQIFQETL